MTSTICVSAKENDEPQVRFEVSAQREIKANAIEINFSLEKKASSLEASTKAMQALIEKIRQTTLAHKIPSQDIQIQNTYMSSADWLFGKDYVVTSRAKIIVRNLELWGKIAKELTHLDNDMKFSGVSYLYPKSPEIWETLLINASREAQDRKAQYERLFKVKLHLSYLRDMRIKPYEQSFGYRKVMTLSAPDQPQEDLSTILPTQTYQVTLDVGYNMSKDLF
jgi:hypothetical protein